MDEHHEGLGRPAPSIALALLLLAGCGPAEQLQVNVAPEHERALQSFVEFLGDERVFVAVSEDPGAAGASEGNAISLVADLDCGECFRVDSEGSDHVVHASSVAGLQYGLADVLEGYGYRFSHPWRTRLPDTLIPASRLRRDQDPQQPEIARRGLHLHTLHPIEGYFAFWEPGADNLRSARRIVDWVIKNRGNHVQWVALDNITDNSLARTAWQAHTAAILDEVHARGITAGLGIQLFGSGNLQRAFDLLDEVPLDPRPVLRERLGHVTEETPFDLYNLSFGEFFEEGPEAFLANTNAAFEVLQELAPDAEMSTVVHVGADLVVHYDDQDLIYYLLAQYADPGIVPWVHTVMYYNLFDDPGGSYHHDDYDQHRGLLLSRLAAGEPVGYFPESAYWIAFDNSVPLWLPLYVRSRWTDLMGVREAGLQLDQHVLFSSGWEWGYWQNDAAVLRMNWRLPGSDLEIWRELVGWASLDLPGLISDTSTVLYEALIGERLAPYFASQDSTIELGFSLGIVAQPERLAFADLAGLDEEARALWQADRLEPLAALADSLEALRARFVALGLDEGEPIVAELADGFALDAVRARFVTQLWTAALVSAEGGDAAGELADAARLFDEAAVLVAARKAGFHHPDPELLTAEGANATLYAYGYLNRADTLCFWRRELVQAGNAVTGASDAAPGCAL